MYKALYRKYRPMTFDDVVSQPHITTTLRNQLINNKTAHAYLFTGSRGTGKTTCARILAKALNCEHLVDGNPCLECEICHDADASALADIVEIDAASNNGVNDIRDLRDGAVYTAERCKYRVYIIDEVHMLTKEAFNALLKIMEEPPPHVKFILATTEVHKVLPTILSRCQRYDFRRILPADITDRLMYVAEKEQINLDREAAELIAKTADGGMRDALSLLDQCVAFSNDITLDIVSNAAGIAGREPVFDIIEAIADNNASKAVEVINMLYNMSKDMQKLCEELIAQFRNIMLAKAVPENIDLLVCMPNELERIITLSDKLTLDEIMSKLDILQSCNERIARVSAKRVEMEMSLLKLCAIKAAPVASVASPEILAKIEMLERKLAEQPVQQNTRQNSRPQYSSQQQIEATDLTPIKSVQLSDEPRWQDILDKFAEICPSVNGALSGSYAKKGGGYMFIATTNSFFIQLLRNKENVTKLMEAIYLVTGEKLAIKTKYVGSENNAQSDKLAGVMARAKENNIPVEQQQ